MVEFIDIPNEDGDITDFDFKVNGKVYHAGIDQNFEFGSEGIAPLAGCGYDNAADYADNLDKYISRANSEYFEVSDEDWSAIVDHFRDLIQANEDKYSDTWEDFGDEDWDEEDDPLYGYGEDDLVESKNLKESEGTYLRTFFKFDDMLDENGELKQVDEVTDWLQELIDCNYLENMRGVWFEDYDDTAAAAGIAVKTMPEILAEDPEAQFGYSYGGPDTRLCLDNAVDYVQDDGCDDWVHFGIKSPYDDDYYDEDEEYDEDDLVESAAKKAPLTEAVKKASLNNLVAEILKSDPPKPIKRPGDAVKWFKDLAKDKEFVKEQTNKFIDGKKLDKAIDFLENINYLLTIGESEATKLVKKYAKDEKKFPLIKA